MSNTPKVTVLMPVYNGEKYLREATESILNQTYTDFEFLIIDDGSTDNSAELVESYHDPRIRLVRNGANLKLIETLNRGLKLAVGEYIARMDCDDISLPRRLEIQTGLLDRFPDVGVAGGRVRIVDERLQFIAAPERPITVLQNRWRLLYKTPLMHPTAVFRRSLALDLGGYSPDAVHAEDYDLWSRMADHCQIRQVPDIVLLLRKHDANIGAIFREEEKRTSVRIAAGNILRYAPKLVDHSDALALATCIYDVRGCSRGSVYFFKTLIGVMFRFVETNGAGLADMRWITSDTVVLLGLFRASTRFLLISGIGLSAIQVTSKQRLLLWLFLGKAILVRRVEAGKTRIAAFLEEGLKWVSPSS